MDKDQMLFEIQVLNSLLARIPKENVTSRLGFEARLRKVKAELADFLAEYDEQDEDEE